MKCVFCGKKIKKGRKNAKKLESGGCVCSELCYYEETYTKEIRDLRERIFQLSGELAAALRIVSLLTKFLRIPE